MMPGNEPVAEPAREQHPRQRASADHDQEQAGQPLAELEAPLEEGYSEGLESSQEEVPERGADDQDEIGSDR